jgi:hypothetical protein
MCTLFTTHAHKYIVSARNTGSPACSLYNILINAYAAICVMQNKTNNNTHKTNAVGVAEYMAVAVAVAGAVAVAVAITVAVAVAIAVAVAMS